MPIHLFFRILAQRVVRQPRLILRGQCGRARCEFAAGGRELACEPGCHFYPALWRPRYWGRNDKRGLARAAVRFQLGLITSVCELLLDNLSRPRLGWHSPCSLGSCRTGNGERPASRSRESCRRSSPFIGIKAIESRQPLNFGKRTSTCTNDHHTPNSGAIRDKHVNSRGLQRMQIVQTAAVADTMEAEGADGLLEALSEARTRSSCPWAVATRRRRGIVAKRAYAIWPAPLLLKLHGDLHHPERIVATKGDYEGFLAKYALLATNLSNQLITKTAVLIGYSLDDPDFRQLWHVVTQRLGRSRRPAYALTQPGSEASVRATMNCAFAPSASTYTGSRCKCAAGPLPNPLPIKTGSGNVQRRSNAEQALRIAVGDAGAVGIAHGEVAEEAAGVLHRAVGIVDGEHDPVHADLQQKI